MARARISVDVTKPDAPVFVISVAAELSGMHPQTLRGYDRIGLVTPGRTAGGGRRYSLRDIETLRQIAQLTATGIGIEGVKRILDLEREVEALRVLVGRLQAERDAAVVAAMTRLPVVRPPGVITSYRPQSGGPFRH
jgi:MerR family transcriptional regulator/heat shock protein HspR